MVAKHVYYTFWCAFGAVETVKFNELKRKKEQISDLENL